MVYILRTLTIKSLINIKKTKNKIKNTPPLKCTIAISENDKVKLRNYYYIIKMRKTLRS